MHLAKFKFLILNPSAA